MTVFEVLNEISQWPILDNMFDLKNMIYQRYKDLNFESLPNHVTTASIHTLKILLFLNYYLLISTFEKRRLVTDKKI